MRSQLLDKIAGGRDNANLSSAVRQYVMQHFYSKSAQPAALSNIRPDFFLQSVAGA